MYPTIYSPFISIESGYHIRNYHEVMAAERAGKEVSVLPGAEQGRLYVQQWSRHRAVGRHAPRRDPAPREKGNVGDRHRN